MTKILLAGIFHETHSFTEDRTTLVDFMIHRGQDLLDRIGDGSQVDGFLATARRLGWEVIPTANYLCGASGMVDHAVFELFWQDVEPVLTAQASALDGIFLSLHGAMVTTQLEDVDGELLKRIRAIPGTEKLPIFGVYDLHATLTQEMGALSDGLVCYRLCPHDDTYESAVRATELLARCLKTGIRPRQHVLVTNIVWPPTGTGTRDGAMHALEEAARRMERDIPGVLAVNVVGGYAYSDVRDAGVAFGIITEGDDEAAKAALRELEKIAWTRREEGIPKEHDLDEVVRSFVPRGHGPVLLVEPADNIGGGGPGDCTDVLRALVKYDVADSGVIIADVAAVAALKSVPIGGRITLPIGGKGSRLDHGPLTLEVELVSRSDGCFELEDRQSQMVVLGSRVSMGDSAVVRHGGVTILLTGKRLAPMDLGQWRSQGIEPEKLSMIGIKAAVGHRRAYDPIAASSFTVSTAGPCTSDLARLPYKRLRRPVYPLDDDAMIEVAAAHD
ncbi:MAG: M81 family metallopeptidase [Alphaproteobacteria bacterium]|nr:M81 family metallopeptidase [Alphaproteobacteria bacterium]